MSLPSQALILAVAFAAASPSRAMTPEELQAYAGDYPLMPDFSLKVFERGGKLHIQGSGQQALATEAVAKDVFTVDAVGAEFRFERDTAGRVVAVVLHQGGQVLRGARQ